MPPSIPRDVFLNIDKPVEMTSRDVVNRFQRLDRKLRVGHAGTLDPMATGVLVLATGRATRLIRFVQQMPKTYRAQFRLGVSSDTDDAWGQWGEPQDTTSVSIDQIAEALQSQIGTVMQQPPAYSALKVQGQRAYDLARKGGTPDLKARPVVIDRIDVLGFHAPLLELEIVCGSGTYIRSVARDLGEALGCGALMSGLRRTRIGGFDANEAFRLPQDDEWASMDHSNPIPFVSVMDAFRDRPCVKILPEQIADLEHGRPLVLPPSVDTPDVVVHDGQRQFLAWMERDARETGANQYRATVNWVPGRTDFAG